jgi:hypothetical protein
MPSQTPSSTDALADSSSSSAAPSSAAPAAPWPTTLWPLAAVLLGTALFGAVLMLAPRFTRQGFGLLMFNNAQHINSFAPEAVAYISLVHGVLGAVMVGWALAMLGVLVWLWSLAPRWAWRVVALSVGGWLVVDTTFSLSVGAWQNALLNSGFGAFFALGLFCARPRQPNPRQAKVA